MKRFFTFLAVLGAAITLSGCVTATTAMTPMVKAASTTKTMPIKGIEEVNVALACIAESGAFKGLRAAVSPWADGTGKANMAAAGGPNGSMLPQATTASFVTQALLKADVTVQDFYSMAGESNLRQMGTNHLQASLASLTTKNEPNFIINGSWLTLDFEQQAQIDAQVGGIGPIASLNGAKVTVSIEVVKPGTREIMGQSLLGREIFSSTAGLSFGRVLGNTLVTGEATVSRQQAIQLESAAYMVGLGVADALSKNPSVPATCRAQVAKLLGEASPAI